MAEVPSFIRVNLRFGIRTDPTLMRELSALSPKDRARWVRAWMLQGWQGAHSGANPQPRGMRPGGVVPRLAAAPPRDPIGAPTAAPASDLPTETLEDGILGFLGERIC